MGDEHFNTILKTEKSSVENLVPIPREFKGIFEDICDVPSCDHFDAECGLINSLLSRDSSIISPKIDFLPEEFVGKLDLIDPIYQELMKTILMKTILMKKKEILSLISLPLIFYFSNRGRDSS
ncbi:hypothetical protein Tco_0792224 [Tanacetum coccineum]